MAILRSKRDADRENIPDEVLNFIAEKVDSNIRELEGAYIQVITYAKRHRSRFNSRYGQESPRSHGERKGRKNVNVNEILKAVCLYYSVKIQDVRVKKTKRISFTQTSSYVLNEGNNGYAFMSIGELLGGRDHTTVMHGVNKIQGQIAQTGKVTQDIVNVKQIIFNE